MKIQIDTDQKQVIIESAGVNEIEKIKAAIIAMNFNPDDFTIIGQTSFIPTYYPYPYYPYPTIPYQQYPYGTNPTCVISSADFQTN